MQVFNETQRFNQWWLQLINIGLLVFLLFCLYSWFIAKETTGNVIPSEPVVQVAILISIIPVIILLYLIRLKKSIDEIGIHYQFQPFHFSKKTIRWSELENCYVRTYRPIKEYGGWGYRTAMGKKGHAFNVKGNQGIQLELKTGKKLLIGTQKEEDAQKIIERYFKTNDE